MTVSLRRADDVSRDLEARFAMNDLRERRPAAVTELVRVLTPSLHRFVRRLVGQDADAEDVTQTVFVRTVQEAGKFVGTHDDLRRWIFTVAYRAAVDVLRGRRKIVPLDDRADAAPGPEPSDRAAEAADIRKALATLDPRDQAVLTLKYQDDFSNQEIARILDLEAGHVGVLVWRAKQNLRRALP